MTDTPNIKLALKKKLKHYFGRQWANKLGDSTGYTADYVRKYFQGEQTQPVIALKAAELIEDAKLNEQDLLKKLE